MEKVVSPFADQINVKLLSQINQGPATARNTGAKHAKGEYVVFLDDDCSPIPDWLEILEQRCAKFPGCMIGGKTINGLADNPYAEASQILVSYLYEYYNMDGKKGALFFTSNNITIPFKLFHIVGGFDQKYLSAAAEDRDFCDRWLFSGFKMEYDPDIIIIHHHELNFKKFWKQHFGYGYGASKFHRMRSKRSGEKLRLEPLSFYINLMLYALNRTGRRSFFVAILLFISQFANALGFLLELAIDKFGEQ